ncbi:DUF1194 domain-containing protein [Pseudovibrio sp. SPO723]|uniref:DUF1194 domain-containing protein n=1 Tax=Nesiotobacter zosterae TaxID=392721 RepID=UPI0029C118CA|nr:DUF1194 domain-containing protein [Pseudovibrio sp. SPO723]MDX5595264.1 DUF1194 domain-containing protein [Pseudovibrio sp. SPO723]
MFKHLRLCVLLLCFPVFVASASSEELDLELVLLADATGSIDNAEIRFQRQGYAEAITDPAVVSAITDNIYGKIAVTYIEWGATGSQDIVVDWMVIDGAGTAAAFAERLMEPPRRAYGRNAIGEALLFGMARIESNSYTGLRRVIDLSADSATNFSGPPISSARETVVNAGITINGLAILCRHCSGRPANYDLEKAFAERIIGGPGSFVVTADTMETFSDAVRRKLILEIAGIEPETKVVRLD